MSNGNTPEVTLKTKLSEVPPPSRIHVKKSTYWHRVKTATFKMSKSSNNPMFELEVEICDHAGYPDGKGGTTDPNGVDCLYWLSLTPKAAGNVANFFNACGLPTDIDLEKLIEGKNGEFLVGQKFIAMGFSNPTVQMDEVSGQPMKNPFTGEDVVSYQYKITEVFPRKK